ncbi:hypothetical protein RRG08_009036 [Elysia crispata]|uniref:Uncharacterized protein n=1 Tax=Elysia crispata TaxID=231223 RepID=A0AAE0XMU8_9GAST|nr:hypothetical protein RRG08_009036 [Elysia crispata]
MKKITAQPKATASTIILDTRNTKYRHLGIRPNEGRRREQSSPDLPLSSAVQPRLKFGPGSSSESPVVKWLAVLTYPLKIVV